VVPCGLWPVSFYTLGFVAPSSWLSPGEPLWRRQDSPVLA